MIKFIWDESYSVGNEEIDRQHQRIFELGNSLSGSLSEGDVKKIVMELYRYTRQHFSAEEKLMKQTGYPGYKAHKRLHEDLISKLNAVSLKSFADRQSLYDFKRFVYEWIIDHIMNHDSEFFGYARKIAK